MANEGEIVPLALPPAEEAGQAAPSQMRNGMKADVARMIESSRTGWLTKYQVIYLLENWRALGLTLSTSTPHLPPSGTLFLIDRHVNRYFRKDGHQVRSKRSVYSRSLSSTDHTLIMYCEGVAAQARWLICACACCCAVRLR